MSISGNRSPDVPLKVAPPFMTDAFSADDTYGPAPTREEVFPAIIPERMAHTSLEVDEYVLIPHPSTSASEMTAHTINLQPPSTSIFLKLQSAWQSLSAVFAPKPEPVKPQISSEMETALRTAMGNRDAVHTRPKSRRISTYQEVQSNEVGDRIGIRALSAIQAYYKVTGHSLPVSVTSIKPTSPEQLQKVEKALLKEVPKDLQKAFKRELAIQRAALTPETITHDLKINGETVGKEESSMYNLSPSKQYLEQLSSDEFDLLKEIQALKDNKYRVSESKKDSALQGMPINALMHKLIGAAGETVGLIFRSGAFSVHDKSKMGVSEMDSLYKMLTKGTPKQVKQALKKAGFKDADEFEMAYLKRKNLCISQALSEITAAVTETAKNPQAMGVVASTGKFLHGVEGLLTLKGGEKVMIQDMAGTLAYLSQEGNCTIQIGNNPEPQVTVFGDAKDPKIVITIPGPQERQGETFGLMTTYANTGVNEQETIRQLFGKTGKSPGIEEEITVKDEQGRMNIKTMQDLLNYARAAIANPVTNIEKRIEIAAATEALQKHYNTHYFNPETQSYREPLPQKDVEGIKLRNNLVLALGGTVSEKCKSGKDRTGQGVVSFLVNLFKKANPEATPEACKQIDDQLVAGNSHNLTFYNAGKLGYAFDFFQRFLLPFHLKGELCKSNNAT
jgi:hypothetical protein